MKLFISHSSKNANYGNALVDLLTSIGISSHDIIFTSNDAFGIPIGENIFDWLKNRINEKPYVLYLLSPEYYKSVACLNEMGAAWIVENNHAMIFTPNFDLSSYEFRNGAIDPREIGFYINNENKVLLFLESLRDFFSITNNPVLINQKVKVFISTITKHLFNNDATITSDNEVTIAEIVNPQKDLTIENANVNVESKSRFYMDFLNNKLKDEEFLLAKYIIDTDRFKLGTAWQESHEIANIKVWEDINGK